MKQLPTEIEVNGKICKIPQSWDDINLRQYLRLVTSPKAFDEISLIAVMLDINDDDVRRATVVDLDMIVYPQLGWYMSEEVDSIAEKMTSDKRPEKIEISGKVIDVPYDLKMKEFGQKIVAEQALSKYGDNPLLAMPDIIAIYLYPEFSGEQFDYDKAMKFRDEHIVTLPLLKAYPIGRFFLRILRTSLSRKIHIWQENIPLKRREQAFKILKSLSTLRR